LFHQLLGPVTKKNTLHENKNDSFVYVPLCFAYILPVGQYGLLGGAIPLEIRTMSKRPFVVMGLLDCLAGTLLAPGVLPAFRARVDPVVEGFQHHRAQDYPAGTGHVPPWGQMQCGLLATRGHPSIAMAARQEEQSRHIDDPGAIRMGCARILQWEQAAVCVVFVGGTAVAHSYSMR
jgi:hypothetical protein